MCLNVPNDFSSQKGGLVNMTEKKIVVFVIYYLNLPLVTCELLMLCCGDHISIPLLVSCS